MILAETIKCFTHKGLRNHKKITLFNVTFVIQAHPLKCTFFLKMKTVPFHYHHLIVVTFQLIHHFVTCQHNLFYIILIHFNASTFKNGFI